MKLVRRNLLNSNNFFVALLFIFIMLYINDHSKLKALEEKAQPKVVIEIDHKTRLEKRTSRLKNVCSQFVVNMRVEHSSVFRRKKQVNSCTGSYFHLQGKDHFICNVLKGGSTSWQVFFGENNINKTFLETCEDKKNCPSSTELKIVQVRHPLERLLATYRHTFKNGGWKAQGNSEMEKEFIIFLALFCGGNCIER